MAAPAPMKPPSCVPICSPEQILMGERIDPLDRVKTYSDKKFEQFIQEWAYYYLQEIAGLYSCVHRFGGAGDMGRDVVAYLKSGATPDDHDAFQCKHYDHPLYPGDALPELGKLCYYTFQKQYPVPKKYCFVAPQNIGPALGILISKPDELRKKLLAEWPENKISDGTTIPLKGKLLTYVRQFDFGIVKHKPIEEVIAEHKRTIAHPPRFGGGLIKPPPPDPTPPATIQPDEHIYVNALLAAYRECSADPSLTLAAMASHLSEHFSRSRERFYCAEAIRVFARESLPPETPFEQVQDQVHDVVIDAVRRPHKDGYERVLAVTQLAATYTVMNHPLKSVLKSKSMQGICHQLVNNSRFRWVV